ncbi:MAG: ATP-binding cassette domain-containing protein [Candidatus Hydrothermales bacterium]
MIEVINLYKYYGEEPAIQGISFNVEKGEILGFLGPNGAGKTTTLRIITGYLYPTKGEVLIDGKKLTQDPLYCKKKLGYLPEDNPLYTDLTPREYLTFCANARGIEEKKKKLDEVMEKTQIKEVWEKPIGELSKGYRQRVGIAQALLHDPDVLIMDEPTTGLDPVQIIEIRNLIKELSKEKTILLSTHILPEVEMLASRVIIIHKGIIRAEGKPYELSRKFKSKEIYFVLKGDEKEIREKINKLDFVASYEIEKKEDGIHGKFIPKENDDVREKFAKFAYENKFLILELYSKSLGLEEIFIELTKEEKSERN